MKVIVDTNLWISFLIGHQTQLVRRMLTDLRFDVYVCSRLIEEIRDVAIRDPKDLYLLALADTIGADYIVSGDADLTDLGQYNQTRIMKLADFKAMIQYQ
ncbi:MAG: putative toxin-antitoxin system toxin component, PIN family [Prevotella sp.]|nr:putative toxin-antitoxin system toxin component, PIN family [Prevotella sp.]